VTQFARVLVKAVQQFAVDDHTTADAGADEQAHHIAAAMAGAVGEFAQQTDIAVIVDGHRPLEQILQTGFERRVLPTEVRGFNDRAPFQVQGTGRSHAHCDNLVKVHLSLSHRLLDADRHTFHGGLKS